MLSAFVRGLVSLSFSSPPSKRTPQSWTSENDLGENSMHATHPVYFSLQLFPLSEHSNSNPLDTAGIFLDGDKSPRTPVSKYKISNCSPPLCRASSTGSKGWSPEIVTRLSSSLCNGVEEDEDIDTPGYPCLRNDCGKLRSRLFGESPLTPQDSAGGSINIPRCDLGGDMRTRQRSLSMDTSAAFTWSESPQASPSAKALRRTMSAAERREPLPGCIFDCEDPWDTIGIIMGLPRNESRSTSLEEELKSLGASGRAFGNIATSGDDFGADTLIECYSDSTSSTQFGSHEVKYAQESDVTWHWTSDDMIYDATTNRTPTSRQNPDSLLFVEGGSMHEDSRIDYTTRYLDKDRFASPFDWTSSSSPASALLEEQLKLLNPCTEDAITIPTQNHSPLPIQGPELPVAAVTDEGDCPYTEAESDHRIPSITLAFSPGHPESYLNPIDDNTIYYGPCLFSDNSDVESP
ncbi:hypothetical protein F5887DRAFT_1078054 [Amanita rubescens]|nr:hypothetical protein F5887DRAFT_1078054 [Amanita rubescens]